MGINTAKSCVIAAWLLTSVYTLAQTCQSGDCQPGVIAGPYSASQTAENTAPNFPVCHSSGCLTGSWTTDQIEGIDAQQNIGSSYQFFDGAYNLDTNIAVSLNGSSGNAQVLQWVNFQYIQAFDKVTGNPIFTSAGGITAEPRSVDRLWSTSTQPECRSISGNVQVIYDRPDNEFVISRRVAYSIDGIDHYAFCFALSSGSDLSNGKIVWYSYEYKMDAVLPCVPTSKNCTTGSTYYYFPDWPRIGTWSNGFYITFDLENPAAGFTEAGFEACQLDRADMALGQASNPMTCYTYMVPAAYQPSLIHSLDVADIDSPTGPPSGEPEYFLAIVNPSNAQQQSNGQRKCTSQTTPCTSNQLALFTWGSGGLSGPTFLTVNPYTPGCYDTSAAGRETNTICVPEPSTNLADLGAYGAASCGDYNTPCVDSLGDRLANRLTYNNLSSSGSGPNGEYLTASHVVMESADNQSTGIRYYILNVSNGTASVAVNSGGTSGPPDLEDPSHILWYFMPSAALDKNGNLGFTYTVSGADCSTCETQADPALYFEVLPWMASSLDPPTLIISGAGDEENTYHWGQYAATVVDPSDDLTFYGVGEYFNTSQTGTTTCGEPASDCYTWQTRILRGQYGNGFPTQPVTLAPSGLSFGNQAVGSTSAGQTVTLTNTQSSVLTINSITASSDFAQTNTCGTSVATVGTCTITVTFTPTTTGIRTGQILVSDNAPGSPQVINLSGYGGTPAVTLSQTTLTFTAFPGVPSAAKSIKLTNSGTAPLTVSSIAVSGDYSFSAKGTCSSGSHIVPEGTCTIEVIFTPSVTGKILGTLSIGDNAPGTPHLISLTGTGLTTLSAAPTTLTFASTKVGSTSAEQTVTVTNNSTASQTFTYGTGGDYTVLPGGGTPCGASPATLNPASACTLSIMFSPTTNGTIKGAVVITDTASGVAYNPQIVSLIGTGTDGTTPALSFNPANFGFGDVVMGSSATPKSVKVTNTATSSVTISGVTAGGDFSVSPISLHPCQAGVTLAASGSSGDYCNFSVTFTPTVQGSQNGSVTVTDSAASGPTVQVFSLVGDGVWPITLSPGTLTFAAQSVGTTSAAQIVSLMNYSDSTVNIYGIAASAEYSAIPGGSSPCGGTVPPANGQTPGACTFAVTFTPTGTGTIKGTVTVSHNAAGNYSPQVVSLTGRGQ